MNNGNSNQWQECKLGEICTDISYGYTESASQVPVGPKFLRITDIVPGRINWEDVPYCPITPENRLKYKLQEGDIVIARTGATTGYNYTVQPADIKYESVFASYLIRYRINPAQAEPFFVGHLLTSTMWKGFVEGILGGSAQPGANAKQFADFEILLPPLPEQRAIAAVLSSLDDKIDLLNRQNKTLEGLAVTLWRKMFVEDADPNWKITILSDHVGASRGLSYKGNGLAEINMGIPMHNLNSVYEGGGYKYEGIKYYTGNYQDKHVIKPGDIIVTNTEQGHEFRLIGFPAVVPHCFGEKGIFSQHIYKLNILKKSYLTSQFIYYLIMTPKVREQIIGATNGSTVNMLAIDGLQRPEFSLPPEEKVKQFSETVKLFWQKQAENKTEIGTLAALRDSLLPKLMSGEVRVKV